MKKGFSDRDIGKLIQRATELQVEARRSSEQRLTLEEIEQIAVEMGIDPTYLRHAALEMERDATRVGRRLLRSPFSIDLRRLATGTLTEAQWERTVMEMRAAAGKTGSVSHVGKSRDWSSSGEFTHTNLSISDLGGESILQLKHTFWRGGIVLYFLALAVTGMIAGIALDGSGVTKLALWLTFGGSVLGGLAAAHAGVLLWARRQRDRFSDLMNRLQNLVQSPPAGTLETGAQSDSYADARQTIDVEDETPGTATSHAAGKRRLRSGG